MSNENWSGNYFSEPIVSITPLSGGLQHQVDLIKLANQEKWICKKFSAGLTWLGPTTQFRLEFTQAVATVAANELGLTFSARQDEAHHSILTIGDRFALIFPYCEGEILEIVNTKQAYILGSKLAQLHLLSFPEQGAENFPAIILPEERSDRSPWLSELIDRCNFNRHYEAKKWVVSHRDIHMNNIVWHDSETPHLIDWESAGYIHPFVELIGLAVNCAGMANSIFAAERFRATLLGYAEFSGNLPKMDVILWEQTLHSWLLWFAYCLKQGWENEAWQTLKAIEFIQASMAQMQQLYAVLYQDFNE